MSEFYIEMVKCVVLNPVYLTIIILGILSVVFYKKFRGFMGEFWVKTELIKLPKKYLILNNIMVEDNGYHQIDHIVISKYGIFVIEMKNYYGLITGKEFNDKWVQYLGKNKYYFKNPIHQNYGHVQALKNVLNLHEKVFIPIVCISNQAKLGVQSKSKVVQLDFLIDLIKSYKEVILEEDINLIKNKILSLNIKDKRLRKEHVKNIKNKISTDNDRVNNMICPKCGGDLVIRNGKNGNFIGCKNFPKCRYTKNR